MVKLAKNKPNILERRREEKRQNGIHVIRTEERRQEENHEELFEEKNYANLKHKYIRMHDYGFIVWPVSDNISHRDMYERMGGREGLIVSAGFVTFINGRAHLSGRSESLDIGQHETDQKAIEKQFGLAS